MRSLAIPFLLLILWQPIGHAGQDGAAQQDVPEPAGIPLEEFVRTLPGDGLPLDLVHLNSLTVPIFFQPPTMYVIRSRAAETTLLYVQGTAERDVVLDTTTFTIEQGGATIAATPMNIRHFDNGTVRVPQGERVDGILAFEHPVDLGNPFTVRHGAERVEFGFRPEVIAVLTAPPAQ